MYPIDCRDEPDHAPLSGPRFHGSGVPLRPRELREPRPGLVARASPAVAGLDISRLRPECGFLCTTKRAIESEACKDLTNHAIHEARQGMEGAEGGNPQCAMAGSLAHPGFLVAGWSVVLYGF